MELLKIDDNPIVEDLKKKKTKNDKTESMKKKKSKESKKPSLLDKIIAGEVNEHEIETMDNTEDLISENLEENNAVAQQEQNDAGNFYLLCKNNLRTLFYLIYYFNMFLDLLKKMSHKEKKKLKKEVSSHNFRFD